VNLNSLCQNRKFRRVGKIVIGFVMSVRVSVCPSVRLSLRVAQLGSP